MRAAAGLVLTLLLLGTPELSAQEAFWEDAHTSISEYPPHRNTTIRSTVIPRRRASIAWPSS